MSNITFGVKITRQTKISCDIFVLANKILNIRGQKRTRWVPRQLLLVVTAVNIGYDKISLLKLVVLKVCFVDLIVSCIWYFYNTLFPFVC